MFFIHSLFPVFLARNSGGPLQNSIAQKTYLECGFVEIERASELKGITGENLLAGYARLARNHDGLRSALHGLDSILRAGIAPLNKRAQALLDTEIEGFAIQQWSGVGGCVSEWMDKAGPADLSRAAASLSRWADALLALKKI